MCPFPHVNASASQPANHAMPCRQSAMWRVLQPLADSIVWKVPTILPPGANWPITPHSQLIRGFYCQRVHLILMKPLLPGMVCCPSGSSNLLARALWRFLRVYLKIRKQSKNVWSCPDRMQILTIRQFILLPCLMSATFRIVNMVVTLPVDEYYCLERGVQDTYFLTHEFSMADDDN